MDVKTDEQFREHLASHLERQTQSLETIKTILVLFTVLLALGALCWAIVFIRG